MGPKVHASPPSRMSEPPGHSQLPVQEGGAGALDAMVSLSRPLQELYQQRAHHRGWASFDNESSDCYMQVKLELFRLETLQCYLTHLR